MDVLNLLCGAEDGAQGLMHYTSPLPLNYTPAPNFNLLTSISSSIFHIKEINITGHVDALFPLIPGSIPSSLSKIAMILAHPTACG